MKKLKYLILILLLLPIMVYAKTPNKEETLKVIEKIENIFVDENMVIKNISIGDNKFTLVINKDNNYIEKEINYEFDDKSLSFKTTNKEDNIYAFYLYSILENKSAVPYDMNNYYNTIFIDDRLINQKEDIKTYIDDTKTFGLTVDKKNNSITYHYYFDGDYPIIEKEMVSDKEFTNPDTRNYSVVITVMLIIITIIGIYTYFDVPNKRIKGENL